MIQKRLRRLYSYISAVLRQTPPIAEQVGADAHPARASMEHGGGGGEALSDPGPQIFQLVVERRQAERALMVAPPPYALI